jgi:hypothetical protein
MSFNRSLKVEIFVTATADKPMDAAAPIVIIHNPISSTSLLSLELEDRLSGISFVGLNIFRTGRKKSE